MPFRVGYSQRPQLFTQVTLITAGEDQVHVCTPTIFLEATVDGIMTGHTVEWEQIGGTLVTLINGNTLTPHFDAVDSTDKTFRVYIDRGTPIEQFDDVMILKTPTSFANCSMKYDQPAPNNIALDPYPVDCADITAFVNVSVDPPTVLEGEDTGGVNIVVELEWEHPIVNTRFNAFIEQYTVVENGTLIVHSVPPVPIPIAGDGGGPPTDPLEYDGTFADYRIDTYYNISGKKFVKESCTQPFSTLPQPLVKAYNSSVRGLGFSHSQSTFSRVIFGNIFLQNEDTANVSFNLTQSTITRVNYTFISISEGQDPVAVSFDPTTPYINITRFGGTGIGGG